MVRGRGGERTRVGGGGCEMSDVQWTVLDRGDQEPGCSEKGGVAGTVALYDDCGNGTVLWTGERRPGVQPGYESNQVRALDAALLICRTVERI